MREKREERREKREERDKHDQDERVEGRNGSVPEWRDGTEKVRSLRGKREESRGKREERREKRARIEWKTPLMGTRPRKTTTTRRRVKREGRRENI